METRECLIIHFGDGKVLYKYKRSENCPTAPHGYFPKMPGQKLPDEKSTDSLLFDKAGVLVYKNVRL